MLWKNTKIICSFYLSRLLCSKKKLMQRKLISEYEIIPTRKSIFSSVYKFYFMSLSNILNCLCVGHAYFFQLWICFLKHKKGHTSVLHGWSLWLSSAFSINSGILSTVYLLSFFLSLEPSLLLHSTICSLLWLMNTRSHIILLMTRDIKLKSSHIKNTE